MIYLIVELFIWLLLAAIPLGFAGWAYAAHRGAPARAKLLRERERLVRDLGRLAAGDGGADPDAERARAEAELSLARVRDSRIAELENAVEQARSRAADASAEAAELRRQLEGVDTNAEELDRLRTLSATLEHQRAREIEADVQPVVEDETVALQAWRLRYFEQRVRYLEQSDRAPAAAAAAPIPEASPLPEWQVREAQARAAFLEDELRKAAAAPAPTAADEPEPFAANADVDVLLRWRLLYLERRVAHLQGQAAVVQAPQALASPTNTDAAPDPDRWKWRARYLESRVRHLEQRPVAAAPAALANVAQSTEDVPVRAPVRAAPPATRRAKPPTLSAARNGAPDDLTLIESISQMQQTTLYALGVFHFEQIAAWTPEHIAWVDQYLRLRGRIEQEEWLEQAADLARDGPSAARRVFEEQD